MKEAIDFSEFYEIKTEHTSIFRKIKKHKYLILSIIFNIIIIILIIVISNKNITLNKKRQELSNIDKKLNEINSNISSIEQNINSIENTKFSLLNDLNYIKKEISNIQSEYNTLENNNFKLLYNKNDLISQKDYINNQISYKEKFLKEEELKIELIEKQNLYNKMFQRFNNLSLSNSNIITDLYIFESISNTKILNKCYDSEIYGYNYIYKFHENCDGYPLLILIKTKKGEKIGAYTSVTNEGIKNIKDENSLLMNYSKIKYFLFNKDNKKNIGDCVIYSHYDEFPKFGNDFVIYNNGKGEYVDNNCYINFGDNYERLLDERYFEIDIMEIYKVKGQ